MDVDKLVTDAIDKLFDEDDAGTACWYLTIHPEHANRESNVWKALRTLHTSEKVYRKGNYF
jgi:hypothetical protein